MVGFELVNGALPAPSQDCNALRLFAAVFDGLVSVGKKGFEFAGQFVSSAFWSCGDGGYIDTLEVGEAANFAQPECFGEQGVVADFWMAVEWQVGAIDRKIAVECRFYLLISAASEWNWRSPVEAVVTDEKVDSSCEGLLKGNLTSIHGGTDLGNFAVILDLEAVVGAGEVFDFGLAGACITEGNDLG